MKDNFIMGDCYAHQKKDIHIQQYLIMGIPSAVTVSRVGTGVASAIYCTTPNKRFIIPALPLNQRTSTLKSVFA